MGKDTNKFWYGEYNKKGEVAAVFDLYMYLAFMKHKGFCRFYTSETDYIFVQIVGGIVDQVDIPFIKRYILNFIRTQPKKGDDGLSREYLKAWIQGKINHIAGPVNMGMIDKKEIPFFHDEKETAHIFFRNTILRVHKYGMTKIQYKDFRHPIWRSRIIDRDFELISDKSVFEQFLIKVLSPIDEIDKLDYFDPMCHAIGYIIHGHKDATFMPALVLNDNNTLDNSQGGTGKGIISKAIAKFKKTVTFDGKKFDPSSQFSYQRLNFDTTLMVIDDIHKKFDVESLFSVITDGIPIEKKHRDEFYIPFENSPKIILTTNYALKIEGASARRRIIDIVLKARYSDEYTPKDDFDHVFFDDWDKQEWLKFDNFIIKCTQLFLTNGLTLVKSDLLERKRIMSGLGETLFLWIESKLEIGTHNKRELLTEYIEESKDKKMSAGWFTKHCRSYSTHKGWIFEVDRTNFKISSK